MKASIYFLSFILSIATISLASCQSSEKKAKYLEEVKNSKTTVQQSFNRLQTQYQRRLDLLSNFILVMQASPNANKLSSYTSQIKQIRSSYTTINSNDLVTNKISSSEYTKYIDNENRIGKEIKAMLSSIKSQKLAEGNSNFEDLIAQIEGTDERIKLSKSDFEVEVKNHNSKYSDHKIDL